MASDPEARLVRALSTGDAEQRRRALGELYDRHAEGVLNVVWRLTGDWATAEDVTQEVFLALPGRIASFRGESALAAWLYRVAVNRAIDVRRHAARRPAARLSQVRDEDLLGAHPPQGSVASEPEVEEADPRARAVQAALLRLSPKLRAIAVLRYVEGLSYEQLAEVLGVRLGTIKSRLSRAHEALTALLKPLHPGP